VPIDLGQVIMIGLVASPVLWIEELRKAIARRRQSALEPKGA
jgi:hypothetical protein